MEHTLIKFVVGETAFSNSRFLRTLILSAIP